MRYLIIPQHIFLPCGHCEDMFQDGFSHYLIQYNVLKIGIFVKMYFKQKFMTNKIIL